MRLARSAGGGVAPRQNDRITESATKESREAKRKTKKAIQESNGKRQDERTTTNEKGNKEGEGDHGERQKREEKNEERKKEKRKGKKRKGTYQVLKVVKAVHVCISCSCVTTELAPQLHLSINSIKNQHGPMIVSLLVG